MNSNDLLKTITNAQPQPEATTKLAKVTSISGGTYVQFYGEDTPSQMNYKKITSVGTLAVNNTVILTKINGSYIITGRVS